MNANCNDDLPNLVELASVEAAKEVIRIAIATNTPVIIWEDERIKEVDPRTIVLPGCDPANPSSDDARS